MSAIKLIVGLANPGPEYAHTRHNAGAWFIEDLLTSARSNLRFDKKFHGLCGTVTIDSRPLQLLVPTTFMNRSGQSVTAFLQYYKIIPSEVLVAHDDIDLPVGITRLKYDGGDGGHNGLKDIIAHLHTKQFLRLRIGVGRPPHRDVIDYVLKPPSKSDRLMIDDALIKAQHILPYLLTGDIQQAMQYLHTEENK